MRGRNHCSRRVASSPPTCSPRPCESALEGPDELRRRIETLKKRIASLCAALLRFSASLDLEIVLRKTVESARALTGARYGLITTVDAAGRPQGGRPSAPLGALQP